MSKLRSTEASSDLQRSLAEFGRRTMVAVFGGVALVLIVGFLNPEGVGSSVIATLAAALVLFLVQVIETRRSLHHAEEQLSRHQVEDEATRQKTKDLGRERVRSLASVVSGRLNNALMVILGSLDMAERRSTDALQRAEFDSIRSGVADANRICCRLSHIASGTSGANVEQQDLIESIRRIVPMIRARAGGSIRVQLTTEADELLVHGAAEGIIRLLQQVVNIHLATVESSGRLSLLARKSRSSQNVVLDIESTGLLPLEPDEILESALTGIPEASIQLDFSERQVRRSRLRLPVPQEQVLSWQSNAETGSWGMPLERDVLVVENNEDFRNVMVRMLDANGCAVRAISTAEAGRDVFARFGQSIGLAIVDLSLPRQGGIAFSKWIRENHPGIPLLMVSAESDVAIPDTLASDPGVVLLEKPFMQPHFEAAIERLVPLRELSALTP